MHRSKFYFDLKSIDRDYRSAMAFLRKPASHFPFINMASSFKCLVTHCRIVSDEEIA
jgi:hypothetical protein